MEELLDQAYEQFVVNHLGLPWEEWFQNPRWIIPVKHAEATYESPIKGGINCQIEICINSISNSSFVLNTSFLQEQPCCSVQTVHVTCCRETKRKIEIPPSIKMVLVSKL